MVVKPIIMFTQLMSSDQVCLLSFNSIVNFLRAAILKLLKRNWLQCHDPLLLNTTVDNKGRPGTANNFKVVYRLDI